MKKIIILLLIIFSNNLFAQFAIIEDKDGYVNIRKGPNSSSEIIGKLTEKDIFWCFEKENDWYPIDIESSNNNTISGYVHKSRIKFISDYESIPSIQLATNKIIFEGKGVKVELKTKLFDKKLNIIEFNTSENYKYVDKINDKRIWGTDGNIPKKEYEHVILNFENKEIELPKSAMENLFEPNLNNTRIYYNREKDILYITGLNSDGAGGYVFTWIISNIKYTRRITLIPF